MHQRIPTPTLGATTDPLMRLKPADQFNELLVWFTLLSD